MYEVTNNIKGKFIEFNKIAPIEEVSVLGHSFKYRYYRNENSNKDVTLVMLAGGSGLGDSFFYLYDYFMKEYNLLSFSYPMDFKDNDSLSDAIDELIKSLGATNVYLLGSLWRANRSNYGEKAS